MCGRVLRLLCDRAKGKSEKQKVFLIIKNIHTMKLGEKLITVLKNFNKDKEFIECVRGSAFIYDAVKKDPSGGTIDIGVVDGLRARYKGLALEVLIALFFDCYHSLHILDKGKDKENPVSYLVRHKVIAIAMVINENY